MAEAISKKPVVMAVCGKGGVGKTSISAVLARLLSSLPETRVLAIDADPAAGLAGALGISVTRTVDDIRNELIDRIKKGEAGDRREMIARLDYELFQALEENRNLAFLAIGRPELEGCYCQVNQFLREIITSVAHGFDFVIIDGEAGIEQVNRRVMENVGRLVLVSDASAKGIRVAEAIQAVAGQAVQYEQCGLILNRIRGPEEREKLFVPAALTVLGWIPEDDTVRDFDIAGRSFLAMPDCPMIRRMGECLTRWGLK